jgi:hypothetical protein
VPIDALGNESTPGDSSTPFRQRWLLPRHDARRGNLPGFSSIASRCIANCSVKYQNIHWPSLYRPTRPTFSASQFQDALPPTESFMDEECLRSFLDKNRAFSTRSMQPEEQVRSAPSIVKAQPPILGLSDFIAGSKHLYLQEHIRSPQRFSPHRLSFVHKFEGWPVFVGMWIQRIDEIAKIIGRRALRFWSE